MTVQKNFCKGLSNYVFNALWSQLSYCSTLAASPLAQ